MTNLERLSLKVSDFVQGTRMQQMLPTSRITMSSPQYVSFLVRMWREPEEENDWLAQVEHILSGEITYFASLEEMFAYLRVHADQNDATKDYE